MVNRSFTRRYGLALLLLLMVAGCSGDKYPYATDPAGPFSSRAQNKISDMDSRALSRIARSFELSGDMNSAMNMYQRAAIMDPDDTAALLGMGNIFSALGAVDQAEGQYRKALVIEPENKAAMAGLAKVRIAAGKPEEAKNLLTRYIAVHGADAAIYNYLGVAHDLLAEHEAAQLVYAQGLDQSNDDPAILSNMALSFAVAGHYDTAIGLLQKNLNSPATRSAARQNLALVYALSGEVETATEIAATELSAEEVRVNRPFYARLAALKNIDRARAVFLGTLPPLVEEPVRRAAIDPGPTMISPEQKSLAVQKIARHVVEVSEAATSADDEEVGPRIEPETTEVMALVDAPAAVPIPVPMLKQDAPPVADIVQYRVQLASYKNPDAALVGWGQLLADHADMLENEIPVVQTAERDGTILYRLLIDGKAGHTDARLLCDSLMMRSVDCLIVRAKGEVSALKVR